jgi:glycosyltransferase involved in cell wall biosynthesis
MQQLSSLVSVIIPVYNCGEALIRTMQSVLQQTHKQLEVILVNDGSTDESYDLAKAYESEAVKVLKQGNSGAAIARNTGLNASRGKYIQFLDAGDVISTDKIAAQVYALESDPGKVALCNYKQFSLEDELVEDNLPDQSDYIFSSNDPQDFLIRLWGGYGKMNFIQTNCWLVPRHLIDQSGPWRAYRCPDDDGEFFARVLLASSGIVYVPGPLNYYHIAPGGKGQLSKSKQHKYLMNTLLTIDLKHKYLREYGSHPKIDTAIAAQYYRFAVDMYPTQPVLSEIAWRRFRSFDVPPPKIKLGGKIIEFIHKSFGWRPARLFRFCLRELI